VGALLLKALLVIRCRGLRFVDRQMFGKTWRRANRRNLFYLSAELPWVDVDARCETQSMIAFISGAGYPAFGEKFHLGNWIAP
jgi:hypothetical protein